MPKCNHKDCAVSSGYCEELTFGRNETQSDAPFNGYWEIPCFDCAEEFAKNNPDMAKEYGIWPNENNKEIIN
jgi:hypothetical protein